MTKREMERLKQLLKKKEDQEKHDRDFFREVRKRRTEVLLELGIKEEEKQAQETKDGTVIVDDDDYDYFEQDDK